MDSSAVMAYGVHNDMWVFQWVWMGSSKGKDSTMSMSKP